MRSIHPLAAQFCMFDSGKHFHYHLIIVSKDINLPKWGGVCVCLAYDELSQPLLQRLD
jgi:hypothetical protein